MAAGLILLMVCAGVGLVVQTGVNARLSHELGTPLWAAVGSFVGGTLLLLVAAAVWVRAVPGGGRISSAPWWAWTGGAFGAAWIVLAIVGAPRLGAATLLAAAIAGQAAGSLVLDHFGWLGFPQHSISPGRVVGMALVAGGILLVRLT